jgi:hypothetical protein
MVSDPEEAVITLPLTVMPVLTSTIPKVSSFPTRQFRGSFPSAFRFTAYLLAVLRLKLTVTSQPPRTRYPVAGQPSGTGFSPAGLHDLARPHKYHVPRIIRLAFYTENSKFSVISIRETILFKTTELPKSVGFLAIAITRSEYSLCCSLHLSSSRNSLCLESDVPNFEL